MPAIGALKLFLSNFSLILLAICDRPYKFLWFDLGAVGREGDSLTDTIDQSLNLTDQNESSYNVPFGSDFSTNSSTSSNTEQTTTGNIKHIFIPFRFLMFYTYPIGFLHGSEDGQDNRQIHNGLLHSSPMPSQVSNMKRTRIFCFQFVCVYAADGK
jgi:hypothetical protein